MNRLILGKIVLFLFPLALSLYGSVSATLSSNTATKGDVVVLELSAYGELIEFPKVKDIAGEAIIGTSRSSSLQIINQRFNKDEAIKFQFVATKDLVIKPFEIKVDGKVYTTDELHLRVKEPSASKAGDDYQLNLIIDKTEAYIGETINAILEFKYKEDKPVIDVTLQEFKQKGLWIKSLPSSKPFKKDGYVILKQEYVIFPQDINLQKINKQLLKVAIRDFRTNFVQWKKIYSKDIELKVKPLPQNIDVQGEFTIKASVDKMIVNANKPVNLTLKVEGFGNIDDIDPFKLVLHDEVVYDTKPEIKTYIKNGKYGGEFIQKLSIIADKNFTIPSIEFQYFDIKTKTVKSIKTKSFEVIVNSVKSDAPKIETNNPTIVQTPPKVIIQKEDSYVKYLFAFIGMAIGAIGVYILFKNPNKKRVDRPIDIQIKKARGDKQLYEVLIPFSNQVELKETMKSLEENIYNNGKNKIDKKEIIKKLQ